MDAPQPKRNFATRIQRIKGHVFSVYEEVRPAIEAHARKKFVKGLHARDSSKDIAPQVLILAIEKIEADDPDDPNGLWARESEFDRDPMAAAVKERSRIVKWMMAVAKNKVVDEIRRRVRMPTTTELRPASADEDDLGHEGPRFDIVDDVPSVFLSPQARVAIDRDMEKLVALVNSFSPEDQEILERTYWGEESESSSKAIGKHLSMLEETVRTRLHRMRKRFKEKIDLNWDLKYSDDSFGRKQ